MKKEIDTVKKSTFELLQRNNYLESELGKLHLAVQERRNVYEIHSKDFLSNILVSLPRFDFSLCTFNLVEPTIF